MRELLMLGLLTTATGIVLAVAVFAIPGNQPVLAVVAGGLIGAPSGALIGLSMANVRWGQR